MKVNLPRVADAVTIAVGIAVLAVILTRAPQTVPDDWLASVIGEELVLEGVDFSVAPRSLVMVLRSDCVFCRDSMPFYRRLVAADRGDAQIVVAAPPYDTNISDYLASESVVPDSVVLVAADALPVRGTPTLMIADRDGVVTDAWVGQLGPEHEADVVEALFD